MLKLKWNPAAAKEAEHAVEYLTQQQSNLGDRFRVLLNETLERIRTQPEMFAVLETLPNSDYRRALLQPFSYMVVFRRVAERIAIVAVAHTSREPNYWIARRSDH